MMKKIHFIVNPISGTGKQKIVKDLLAPFFEEKEYTLVIKQTAYAGHATALTQASIEEQADIIVACGGDGTINEVASCLVNKTIPLGIIPMGSGNGLASNLAISKNIKKALSIIKDGRVTKIDVGQINKQFFFSNAGLGFDAEVVSNYEQMKKRQFIAYLSAVVKSFSNYQGYNKVEIKIGNKQIEICPFMVFISNSNEMGYNISLTPTAQLNDGLLDVVIIPKITKMQIILLGFLLLFGRTGNIKWIQNIKTDSLILHGKHRHHLSIQKDGEQCKVKNGILDISLLKKSLNVIIAPTNRTFTPYQG